MPVADGKRQRVGGIVGLWHRFKTEDITGHFLHLLFFCPAVAGNRLLYLKRCVFLNIL